MSSRVSNGVSKRYPKGKRRGPIDSPAARNAQMNEDEMTRKWVSQEDSFVLKQVKKKADIRVREGRAKPIDWLAVILRVIDPDRDLLEEDEEEVQLDVVDPEGVFEGLKEEQLAELETEISSYIALETNNRNKDYWQTMRIICNDRRQKLMPVGPDGRAVGSVAADVDKLLQGKTYEQLESLEAQIRSKLRSDEHIDVDYWEQLLSNLLIWKAKAKLKKVYQSLIESRLQALRQQQSADAANVRAKLQFMSGVELPTYDPEPLLKLAPEDKAADIIDESTFLTHITAERRKILKLGYVPLRQRSTDIQVSKPASTKPGTERFDFSAKALYEREVARGVEENEEIFTGEEQVPSSLKPQWAEKYRPRKPRYFNRVQMGYEWNKYNQTHYDHDNPPPKTVQGYKFNIFYPDLIDKTKAPTYRVQREGGRKKGESMAPAGEEDTCLLRFVAGAPYEDIAFRIIDKEWDFSAKRERGFRSSFERGILQLHFQFKKVYYRK